MINEKKRKFKITSYKVEKNDDQSTIKKNKKGKKKAKGKRKLNLK